MGVHQMFGGNLHENLRDKEKLYTQQFFSSITDDARNWRYPRDHQIGKRSSKLMVPNWLDASSTLLNLY